jgi:hypothetical protein
MKFDVYGRFLIDVSREKDGWIVRRIDQGKRMALPDLAIPSDVPADQVPRWLEDLLHESASPGRTIRRIE